MTPIDNAQIAEIAARAEAATPGPSSDVWTNKPACYVAAGSYAVSQFIGRPENAAFIAAARTDVPALLAEVTRLREAAEINRDESYEIVGELKAWVTRLRDRVNHLGLLYDARNQEVIAWTARVVEAEAEVARLRVNEGYEHAVALGFPTWRERAEQAEAEVTRLRAVVAAVEALPEKWREYGHITCADELARALAGGTP